MKKFYLMAATVVFAASVNAQVSSNSQLEAKNQKVASAAIGTVSNVYAPQANNYVEKFGPITYNIDWAEYNTADGIMPSSETAGGGRYVVDKNYLPIDSNVTGLAVNLRPYNGFTDYNDIAGSIQLVNATDPGATIIIDSLYMVYGHKNLSGAQNKVNINIRTGSNGTFGSAGTFTIPNGTIYYKDSIVTTQTLSPSGSPFGTNSSVVYAVAPNLTHSLANGDLVIEVIPDVNTAAGDTFAITAYNYASNNAPVQMNSLATFSEAPTQIYLLRLSWYTPVVATFSSQFSAENLSQTGFTLHSLMPNPAVDNTTIVFELANNSDVRFDIIDMNGRLVQTMNLGNQVAGKTNYSINTSNLASGVYNVVMHANKSIFTKKLSIVR